MFNVSKEVSAGVLDPEGVSDGEYFLVDDVLCSSEGCIQSGDLADRLWVCRLKACGGSAATAETAAMDEWLAARGADRTCHQLGSSSIGSSGLKENCAPRNSNTEKHSCDARVGR